MTQLAAAQRQALCDLLDRVGPDAPTLNEGWTTRDLAAHLAIRDRRPDTLPGIGAKPFAGWTQKVQDEYAARPWPELVDLVRFGPPAYSPTAVAAVGERVNLAEYYIHHEDVLRAQQPASRVETTPELDAALWGMARLMGRVAFLRCPVGVTLVSPGHGEAQARRATRQGNVVVSGRPGDLLLYLSGRREAADVTVEGGPEARSAFEGHAFSL